jgi:serine/threonine-protein kinase
VVGEAIAHGPIGACVERYEGRPASGGPSAEPLTTQAKAALAARTLRFSDIFRYARGTVQGSPFPEFEIGAVLDGRFEVLRILGRGAMGIVLEAKHLGLRQRVALKLLRHDSVASPAVAARFVREAHAAARLKSEHVVRIMDVGKLASGVPYIVMERLEGTDLARRLLEKRRLGFDEVADYLFQTLEALSEAHGVGVIHRDLKPANLFVARLPGHSHSIKVLDFGISKLSTLDATTETELTAARTVLGSPLYMSPEQLEDARNVEPGSDIWSLGVIAYELLTGAPPFQADTLPELLDAMKRGEHAPLADQCPDVPPEFAHVIERCLQADPERRFISAKALTVALAPWANTPERMVSIERILHVRSSRPPKPSESRPPPARPSDKNPLSPRRERRALATPATPRAALVAAGALLTGVCALAWLAARNSETRSATLSQPSTTAPVLPPAAGSAVSAVPRLPPVEQKIPVVSLSAPLPAPALVASAPARSISSERRAVKSLTSSEKTRSAEPVARPLGSEEPLPARPLDVGNPFRR